MTSMLDLIYFITRFADDMKIDNSVILGNNIQGLTEDLHIISAWSEIREMPFNVDKRHIFNVGAR